MTIQAPVRSKFRHRQPKEELAPDHAAVGPRAIRVAEHERRFYIGAVVFFALLSLFGIGAEILGPAKASGIGIALPGMSLLFVAWGWLFAWRPMEAGRALVRHGYYAKAQVVGFERPWWSGVLIVLRTILAIGSRATLTAEVGYRLTLEVPDGQGTHRTLERIIWRAFATGLPRDNQVVGVFYDPQRSDRFVFASDLERLNIEMVAPKHV